MSNRAELWPTSSNRARDGTGAESERGSFALTLDKRTALAGAGGGVACSVRTVGSDAGPGPDQDRDQDLDQDLPDPGPDLQQRSGPVEALLSTLTRRQTDTVRRRLDSYSQTLRQRNRPIRDVRHIFTQTDSDSDSDSSQVHRDSPKRFHTTTRTIRRNNGRGGRGRAQEGRGLSDCTCFHDDESKEEELESWFSPDSGLSTVEDLSERDLRNIGFISHIELHTFLQSLGQNPPRTKTRVHTRLGEQNRTGSRGLKTKTWVHKRTKGETEPDQDQTWVHKRTKGETEPDQDQDPGSTRGLKVRQNQDQDLGPQEAKGETEPTRTKTWVHKRTKGETEPDQDKTGSTRGLKVRQNQDKDQDRVHKRTKDGGVFGVPLKTLLENDRRKCPGIKTPLVFNKLLSVLDQTGLQTEGILRISGSASRLKSLRRSLDRSTSDFLWSDLKPVDAAGLLKLFIRELPRPLLHTPRPLLQSIMGKPRPLLQSIMGYPRLPFRLPTVTLQVTHGYPSGLQSELHQIQALQLLCLVLPESHRQTLQALVSFLARVVQNQEQNRMSLWNVSMVMAPNLLPSDRRRQEVTRQAAQEMEEAVGGAKLVRLLIRHRALMWTVRQMNRASNGRSRLDAWGRRRSNAQQEAEPALSDDVIRVRAPLQLKVSTAMKLDATTTARDVTGRFPGDADSGAALRLYEVGGNIGERRLHPDCFLLDVYRVNPGCDWLIKP
ncbi:hypothetical protein WMY93_033511 [Mugilogobius chulae]|uniref:Rho-GAP domain-containing protein n=1 Tax=Mugilogobius chulae TaxID=88201 RepID=A0AAW0MSP1_9GOBI